MFMGLLWRLYFLEYGRYSFSRLSLRKAVAKEGTEDIKFSITDTIAISVMIILQT